MTIKQIKSTITTGVLLLAFNFTQAQKLELTWGKETVKKNIGSTLERIISNDDNSYKFVLGPEFSNNNYQSSHVLRNNFQHESESNIDVPLKFKGKKVFQRGIYNIDGKMIAFVVYDDSKVDAYKLYRLTIDENSKIVDDLLVDELAYKGRKDVGSFKIEHLTTKKQFLITHSKGSDTKGREELNFKLFKEDLSKVWEQNVVLPYSNKQFEMFDYLTDELNNIFIYGNFIVDKKPVKKILLAYNQQSQKFEEKTIPFSTASRVSDLRFTYENGNLNFTGFYYGEKDGMQGVCFTQINSKTLKTTIERLAPFSTNDMLKFTSQKSLETEKGITNNFDIRQIITKDNGDIFIVAEAYKMNFLFIGGESSTTYHHDNIMVVNVNKDFDLKWVTKIDKVQLVTQYDKYSQYSIKHSSFATISDDQNIYIIYNDNAENSSTVTKNGEWGGEKIETDEKPELVITAAIIDQKSGDFKRENIYMGNKKDKTRFVPLYTHKISNNQFLVYAERFSKYKFGTLIIK